MNAKRVRRLLLAMLVFVAGLLTRSNLGRTPSGDFGRLFGSQLPTPEPRVVTRTVPVIPEGTAPQTTNADPVLGAPAADESATVAPTEAAPQPRSGDVQIVGDANGVAIVNGGSEPPRNVPKLRGGIFK